MGNRKMWFRKLQVWIFLLALLLFSSCNSYLANGMRVAWGRQLFLQGSYQEAMLYFFDAQQSFRENIKKIHSASQAARSLRRIAYNVGLVYSALGQSLAAIGQWQQILDRGELEKDEELHFALLYNIGVLYSQADENITARRYLVQALDLRPKHENARKALELCLLRLQQSNRLASEEDEQILSSPQSGISDEQILNYISREANYRFQRDEPTQKVLRNDW